MIIWSGWGFFVPVIVFGGLIAAEASVEAAFKDDNYYQSHGWPKLAGFVVAAVLIWAVHSWLDRRPKRRLVDADTGQEVLMGGNDSFFFIPLKWWPPICAVIGIIFLFVKTEN